MPDPILREQIRVLQRHQRLIWVLLFPTVLFFNVTLFVHLLLVYIWVEHSTHDGPRLIQAYAITLVDFQGKPVGSWTEAGLSIGTIKLRPEGRVEISGEAEQEQTFSSAPSCGAR
jgi:hypothetical protein